MNTELMDREAIRDILMRYARAIDRVDECLLRSVYWEDAIDDHSVYKGSVDGYIDYVIPRLKQRDQTAHFIGNILIEIVGSIAAVESYFHAYHRRRDNISAPTDLVIAGRYIDRMEKRGAEWRIARREVLFDWYREYPNSGDWSAPPLGHYKTNRFPDDISYKIFEDVRNGV